MISRRWRRLYSNGSVTPFEGALTKLASACATRWAAEKFAMKAIKSNWNQDDWLGRCAWCRRRLDPDREVIGIKARLRPEAAGLLPPGTVQPMRLAEAKRTVPIIIPALDSPARKEGVDAIFQVCSDGCGLALREAFAREVGLPIASGSLNPPAPIGIPAVTREEVAVTWDDLCELGEEASQGLAKRFMEEQPALGIYLSVKSQQVEDHKDSPIIELALCAWQCLSEAAERPLSTATPEQIEAAEAANLATIEKLEDASEFQYEEMVRRYLGSYPQRELVTFMLEVLIGDDAENPELAPDSIGLELLWLKTVVDCLDRPT